MPAPLTIEALRDLGAVERLAAEWERVWELDPSAFTSIDWIVPWFRFYGLRAEGRLEVLIAREAGEVIGIAPLYSWRGTLGGMPVKRVDFLGHNFSMPQLLIARRTDDVVGAFLQHLVSRGGPPFDVLVLRGPVLGSLQLHALEKALKQRGFGTHDYSIPTPMIEVRGTFEEYLKARGKNLKQQYSRAAKRCEAIGPVKLSTTGDTSVLDRVYRLSAQSWKGETGEAIGVQQHVAAFYREVAERFAAKGRLRITLLTIGDRDVAYVYGLTAGRRYYHIDTAYDRTLQEASPGTLVNLQVIKELHEEGFEQYINEGYEEYKARWMSGALDTVELFGFRPTILGRLSALAKLEFEPRAKKIRSAVISGENWQEKAANLRKLILKDK